MLFKKLLRTTLKYKAQFISMIIMIAIGVGVFLGFNMEWYSIDRNTAEFFEQTKYADYRIYDRKSLLGFSSEDIDKIKAIDGVTAASREFAVDMSVNGNDEKMLAVNCGENQTVSTFVLMSGEDYDPESADGVWLSEKFAESNSMKIGDEIKLAYKTVSVTVKVKGLVKSGEYLVCVRDETQIMPNFADYGYAFVSPVTLKNALGYEYYPQINILSDLDKATIEERINAALGKTTLILSRDETYSYSAASGEIDEGKTMGSILPVLFLLIAVLTMVTTMHRVTANEKTQIGTLKALGYRNGRIVRHYTSYGLFIGVVGGALGVLLGYGVAKYIFSPTGSMGTYMDMPDWSIRMPWFCPVVLAGVVAFLALISFLSVQRVLKGTAADALRPYVPKKVKPLAIERTGLWDKMGFGARWNLRDVMRHKARSFMTLFGVVGCMMIIVASLGMQDTVNAFTDLYYNKANDYVTRINLSETVDNATALDLAAKYNGDWCASSGVSYDDKTVSLDVYEVTHDKVRFFDRNDDFFELSDDGAYVCVRIADDGDKKIKPGDTIEISPYGSDKVYKIKIAGVARSLTENIVMSKAYAEKLGIEYNISYIYTDTELAAVEKTDAIAGVQAKTAIIDAWDTMLSIMKSSVFVLIACAVVLGAVVLYNLGVMSYTERYREMATLKVVGFRNSKIARLLISQNTWLTVIGMIIGLPVGVGVLDYLMRAMASEYELKTTVGVLTYVVSIVLMLGVSLAVSFFVARKNRKIDMVEALKCAE